MGVSSYAMQIQDVIIYKKKLTQLSPATCLNFFSRYKTIVRIKVTMATISDPRAAVPK